MTFRFPDPGVVPSPIVSFRDAAFRYSKEDPWLLKGLDFSIDAGTRVALVGANGAGCVAILFENFLEVFFFKVLRFLFFSDVSLSFVSPFLTFYSHFPSEIPPR